MSTTTMIFTGSMIHQRQGKDLDREKDDRRPVPYSGTKNLSISTLSKKLT